MFYNHSSFIHHRYYIILRIYSIVKYKHLSLFINLSAHKKKILIKPVLRKKRGWWCGLDSSGSWRSPVTVLKCELYIAKTLGTAWLARRTLDCSLGTAPWNQVSHDNGFDRNFSKDTFLLHQNLALISCHRAMSWCNWQSDIERFRELWLVTG
jgi:hypothetical protein